ncbi:DUF1295 domain-containing protein [Flexivirga sp.]|uniref:DUF1295 domain-containing protein n=1 Tax=Flexivirga sp. TaxID=1962927 RepID=UPI003F7D9AE7
MGDFAWMALASAVLLAFVQAAAALWSVRVSRWAVADVVWGPGFAAVAVLGLLTGHGGIGRRVAVAALVTVWGARLGSHVWARSRSHGGDDPRYERMARGRSTTAMVLRVFGLQGVIQWVVSLPIQLIAVSADPGGGLWALSAAGILLAAAGLVIEAVADRQLQRYKARDPRPAVLDTGLWAWSRHPNYFGDACVWVGVFLVAAATWPGALTVVSPVVMVGLLVWGSGVRLAEQAMADRPGYAQYREKTSVFVPWPPRGDR